MREAAPWSDGRLAQASVAAKPDLPAFYFINESRSWKAALWKTSPMVNAAVRKLRDNSGMSEGDFLLSLLRTVSRFRVDKSIFDGPRD